MRRRISSLLILGSTAFLLATSGNSQESPKVELLEPMPQRLTHNTGSCCNSPAQKIIVEVPPPEIIIQRAGGVCAPESKGFFQRCGHFKMHQWTHMSSHGHGAAPVSGIPLAFAPQSFVPQSFVPQSFVPQSFVPQSFVPQSFVPQSFVPQSFVPQSVVFAPQSFVPQSGTFTPQASPADDKLDIRAAVKNLSENMEAASKLLKQQAQILKIHDDAIGDAAAILKEISDKKLKLTIIPNTPEGQPNVRAVPISK